MFRKADEDYLYLNCLTPTLEPGGNCSYRMLPNGNDRPSAGVLDLRREEVTARFRVEEYWSGRTEHGLDGERYARGQFQGKRRGSAFVTELSKLQLAYRVVAWTVLCACWTGSRGNGIRGSSSRAGAMTKSWCSPESRSSLRGIPDTDTTKIHTGTLLQRFA